MKFITISEFRGNTAAVRRQLETEREIVLTTDGKPFAMLTSIEPDSVEEEVLAIRRAGARLAINRTRGHARKTGLDAMWLCARGGFVRGHRRRTERRI